MRKYKTLEQHGLSESELRDHLNKTINQITDNSNRCGLKSRAAMENGLFYGFIPTVENMETFHEAMKKELENNG